MKRYFVITHESKDNGHLNVQDLLPASCKLITGVAVIATVKQDAELENVTEPLAFPQALITDLLQDDSITNLFYSYLRTRSNEAESREFFESDILPEIIRILSNNIKYTCLNSVEQQELEQSIIDTFNTDFTDYLYNEVGLYEKGKYINSLDFSDLIAQQTLTFAFLKKEEVFLRTKQAYIQPEPYECGNISLLVNGNSFLLRDYMLTANRTVRQMSKEIIPFYEPLDVNSNIHTVFKSNKNSGDNTLTIRIYIQYEHE
ncbi:MAG: hypothetical protein KAS04_03470 [Candidatus Aenigmarchaeota archaeon]|nr:hypothetical protein [Candidatus Aenigmarchaeota archaeon]